LTLSSNGRLTFVASSSKLQLTGEQRR